MSKKIALVTGGIRGIGEGICHELLKTKEYFVIALATNAGRNQAWLEKQLQAGYKDLATVVCNVADFEDCQKNILELKNKYQRIDVLVNNAGITRDLTLKKMTKTDWDEVIRTDLDSLFNVTKPVLEIMLERGFGRIINMSSVNAEKGQFGQVNYAAAKAGVHGFTKSLALETAKKNITVNTVSPGYIMTDMMRDIPEDILAKIVSQIPVGRLGTAEDVAKLVVFLAAESSSYITGANFSINGGLHLH